MKSPAGWKATIDDNGQITATAPETAKPGDKIDVPVIVTYEDGSKDNTTATVNVIDVPKREVPFKSSTSTTTPSLPAPTRLRPRVFLARRR
ncbi:YPDG domain-containing protein [Corynebacterium jeikeium]|uniref:YPDG domain-containing protein n=1 Tax=Corynebacterium jeikeium TaxID=38289 RepID=UPI000E135422|nr:YPDG domain-containing protein [Corynebacterium jeikeium]STC50280.1 surface protein [Corynebacterium jeikeium]